MKRIALALMTGILLGITTPVLAQDGGDANFEIMKATADKIWRLNKQTGEISICSLDGERLVCTSNTEAIRPPAMTYEEREAEKETQRQANKAKDMEFFDRALNAIRELFAASMEREN